MPKRPGARRKDGSEPPRFNKARHVDFMPDEYLQGTALLTLEEKGAYWDICSLIYSRAGPIPDDEAEIARILRIDRRKWRRLRSSLVHKGKIRPIDGCLTNHRCEIELGRAHHRIGQARENGSQGGRPSTPPADVLNKAAPDFDGTSAEDRGDSRAELLENDLRTPCEPLENAGVLSAENNDLAKPDGFSGEKLTTNYQLPTTKEDITSPIVREPYAFEGRLIRLNRRDLDKWKRTYHAIPDIEAELTNYDGWLDQNAAGEERKKWFHRAQQRLNKLHQEYVAKQKQGGGRNLNESF